MLSSFRHTLRIVHRKNPIAYAAFSSGDWYKHTDMLMGQEERARVSGYFENMKRYQELIKEDLEAYESLPLKEKTSHQARLLLRNELEKEDITDPENWWNKLNDMSELELNALPPKIVKKYHSIANKVHDFERKLEMDYKNDDPRY